MLKKERLGGNVASSLIHIAVANEINKKIKRDRNKLLIGTIAPDISKLIAQSKVISHFFDSEERKIPNIEKFLDKYKDYLYDDFVMGYYIHLYTDYLWIEYFLENIDYNNVITKLDCTKLICDSDTFVKYIYNDYTNINSDLINIYDLDLEIFYNDIPDIEYIINEIPMDKLNIIVDNAGVIIANSKENKAFIFDIKNVERFINLSVKLILSEIEKL